MNKFLKFAGLILLTAIVAVFSRSTEAKAYTYENWKDAVVNDDSKDPWENHYDIWLDTKNVTTHKKSRYNAEALANINNGAAMVYPTYSLLTKDNKTAQLTAFNFPGKVTWKSYDERVCTVDQNGKITMGTHTGPVVVEAKSADGKKVSRVIVLSSTGKGPQWFEDMFVRAYTGDKIFGLYRMEEDDHVDTPGNHTFCVSELSEAFRCYVDHAGNGSKLDIIKKVNDVVWKYDPNDCVDTTVTLGAFLSPFFNVPGKEGIASGVYAYEGHTSTIGYIDGQFFWLDNGRYRPMNENGGEDGNIWGYNSGYKVTNRFTSGLTISCVNIEDTTGKTDGAKNKYPANRDLYFYN